ncbi:MAG TPA: NAD(+) synthase [Pseudogracilibacillus sp.]|nr:NAD(+) synthase [Pseudogracilibacillus sp.]
MEKLVEDIVAWLREKATEARVKGLIVGLSGGLDSAVVAHLMQRAYPEDALAVIMPIHSNPVDMDHANQVVESSGIRYTTVDLTKSHELMMETIKSATPAGEWKEENAQIADANLRARLRMSTLYTMATNYHYLVVGTDNAAEWLTGYFTKYGDGGVDIQPIIDLTKREVQELAEYLGVPAEIIEKKPSADLWTGQTDEDEMGTSYDMIDDYLDGIEIPEKDKAIIESMQRRTEHKRTIAPQFRYKK